MSIDLSPLTSAPRLLFAIPLRPLQGTRFQPTGFPNLGAATYQSADGSALLVESAQSMANRLELTCWNEAENTPADAVQGISHVRVERKGEFLTDSILESHRINSPYIIEGKDKRFHDILKKEMGALEDGPINRKLLANTLLKYDIGSLIHGVFLAKKDLAGGRLRVARALSAFIEASGVRVAASGGVKNDHVNPSGDSKAGFGNVPFARDEYTADNITLFVNLDISQIRGYGLGNNAERLLVLLALYKLRVLCDGDLRLRTACDLEPAQRESISADRPDFTLPSKTDLESDLQAAIAACDDLMTETTVSFDDALKKGKSEDNENGGD